MPKQNAGAEAPTIELVGYKTTWEEIRVLFNEVYHLKRAPRTVSCDPETEEEIHQEILDSLKEHLFHRWGPTSQRNQGEDQLALPGWTPGPSSSREHR